MGIRHEVETLKRRLFGPRTVEQERQKASPPTRPPRIKDMSDPLYKQDIEELRRRHERRRASADEFWE